MLIFGHIGLIKYTRLILAFIVWLPKTVMYVAHIIFLLDSAALGMIIYTLKH